MPMILIKDFVGLSCLYSFEPHSITTGDQDCMQIQGNQNYHWDDIECDVKHQFICETS